MIGDNAAINTLRGTFSASAGVTNAPVLHLLGVPVYIRDISADLRLRGIAAQYDLKMSFDAQYDIVGGDQVTVYNPANLAQPPVYVVKHVQANLGGMGGHKVAYLAAMDARG